MFLGLGPASADKATWGWRRAAERHAWQAVPGSRNRGAGNGTEQRAEPVPLPGASRAGRHPVRGSVPREIIHWTVHQRFLFFFFLMRDNFYEAPVYLSR